MNFEQEYQRLKGQLITGAIVLLGLFILGTVWYKFVENWTWIDSSFMTMITLTTVGFGETHPLSRTSRIFTMVLILLGVVTITYLVNRFTDALIEGYFQERVRLKQEKTLIEGLQEHYIVCGYGRTGRQIALELEAEGVSFVIIDSDPQQIEKARQLGYPAILGDATLDESLEKVRIDRAICLIAALRSDAENLYTILSAKTLNSDIRAIARASTEEAVQKLQRAGADAVVSPYITGGKRLAAAALRPQVMDFVDGVLSGTERSYYLEEFLLNAQSCPCIGQTLSDAGLRSRTGVLVLAIRRADGNLIAGPMGDTRLYEGDLLICMGTEEQLRSLNQLLIPLSGRSFRLPKDRK